MITLGVCDDGNRGSSGMSSMGIKMRLGDGQELNGVTRLFARNGWERKVWMAFGA